MRYSRQRAAILEVIQNNHIHPTAEWIYEEVRKSLPNISLGTVYRNLNQLVDNDVIQAFRHAGTVRYDGNTDQHFHFFCDQCRRIYDIHCSTVDFLENLNNNSQHFITGGQLRLTGTCEKCVTAN